MKVLFLITTVRSKVHAHHATGFLSAMLKQHGHETDYLELAQVDTQIIRQKIEEFKPFALLQVNDNHNTHIIISQSTILWWLIVLVISIEEMPPL